MAVRTPRNICDECGHSISLFDSKSVCPGCQKVLCMHCNLGGLCRDHYNILTPDDQKRIMELDIVIKKYNHLISWNRFLPLLIILPELIFLFAQGWFFEEYWFYGFPIIFCMCLPIFGGTRGARQKLLAAKTEKDNILIKYGFESVEVSAPRSPQFFRPSNDQVHRAQATATENQTPSSHSHYSPSSSDKVLCANCGVKNPLNACFCVGCGKRL